MIHEATFEDDDGDCWATCLISGKRALGLELGTMFGLTVEDRALRTLNRACKDAQHVGKAVENVLPVEKPNE